MQVLGYADRFSARPGERIQFMVSCEQPGYRAEIVRLNEAVPLKNEKAWRPAAIDTPANGEYPGRSQPIRAGSYVEVPAPGLDLIKGITISASIYPTLPVRGREQGIVSSWSEQSRSGFTLGLDGEGHLFWRTGDGTNVTTLTTPEPVNAKRWYALAAIANPATGQVALYWQEHPRGWVPGTLTGGIEETGVFADAEEPILLGASWLEHGHATGHYNGKLDRPVLWSRPLSDDEFLAFGGGAAANAIPDLVADWDFLAEYRGRTLIDREPAGRHGRLVNLPARLVTGVKWTGDQVDFRAVPDQYQAVHFHEDDLEDCEWGVDFAFDVPADLPSGIYAARLEAGDTVDHVPFYVRPAAETSTADILYLGATNTYLAYGNEKLFSLIETDPSMIERMTAHKVTLDARDEYLRSRPEIGASCYDLHADGSGTMYSTRLRPVLTMRPDFVTWMTGELRHFSADLYVVEWMEALGFNYDVATDEDLHLEGTAALSQYKVVVTGGHPEYWSKGMLNALEAYLAGGGRLMYLGGNGFYWVTGLDADYPHVVEIRRGYSGTKSWESAPGEVYQTTSGEPGGLWRYRGRNPNKLTGVGFAAQGWGGAAGYARLDGSRDPRAAWAFEGIGDDEIIGEFGHIMGGASGDEIDRYDLDFGTPVETQWLATSSGRQSDYYQMVIEDHMFMLSGTGGQEEPRVRSDITLLDIPNGGSVFCAPSIAWNASLTINGCDNNVSRLTANVLRRFSS